MESYVDIPVLNIPPTTYDCIRGTVPNAVILPFAVVIVISSPSNTPSFRANVVPRRTSPSLRLSGLTPFNPLYNGSIFDKLSEYQIFWLKLLYEKEIQLEVLHIK